MVIGIGTVGRAYQEARGRASVVAARCTDGSMAADDESIALDCEVQSLFGVPWNWHSEWTWEANAMVGEMVGFTGSRAGVG